MVTIGAIQRIPVVVCTTHGANAETSYLGEDLRHILLKDSLQLTLREDSLHQNDPRRLEGDTQPRRREGRIRHRAGSF